MSRSRIAFDCDRVSAIVGEGMVGGYASPVVRSQLLRKGNPVEPAWFVTFFFDAGDAQSINCTEAAARWAVQEWREAKGNAFEEKRTILTIKGFDDTPCRKPMEISLVAEDIRHVIIGAY